MATLRNDTVIRSADGQGTAAIVTASNIGSYGVATNSTYYVGTTQNIFNRASGAQTLTGVSIDGSSASCTGNSATATILQTARNINGTSFNGSAAITTANWGTARTLTIGSTGKSVDGSAAITWSLAEIGAAATNQTMFVGTTSVAINRASASQTLTGVSIDGTASNITAYTINQSVGTANTPSFAGVISSAVTGYAYLQVVDVNNFWITPGNVNWGLYFETAAGGLLGGTGDSNRLGFVGSGAARFYVDLNNGNGWFGGSLTANTDSRAPIFYDSNNTAYYCDPASTSAVNRIDILSGSAAINTTTPGTSAYQLNFTGQSTADYAQAITWGWSTSGAEAGIYVQSSGGYGTKMYIATTDSFATGSKTAITIDHTGIVTTNRNYLQATGSVRAPIFYDSDNTVYYLDPANTGTSLLVAGKVGIGTVSPLGLLEVRGTNRLISNDGLLQVNSNNNAGIDLGGSISFGGVYASASVTEWAQLSGRKETATSGEYGGYLDFATRPHLGLNTSRIRITSTGNVGIGTTSPTGKLHVYNSAATDTTLESGTSGTTGKLIFKTSDNADLNKYIMQESFYMILNGHANEGFKFRDSASNVLLSIFGAANAYASRVGIGTQTPAQKLHVSGIGYSDTDFRAPIFYDSNNTAYYIDAASASILNTIRLTGKLTNNGSVSDDDGFGVYWDSGESTAYAIYREAGSWTSPYPDLRIAFHTGIKLGANASYNGIRFYNDYDMTTQVMSVNNSGDGLGTNNVYVNNSLQADSSLRAPIFYDSNDTAYYLDPRSASVLSGLKLNGIDNDAAGNTSDAILWINKPNNNDWGIRVTGNLEYLLKLEGATSHSYNIQGLANGSEFWRCGTDLLYHNSNIRAPIFYDSNDTTYYLNPADVSYLYEPRMAYRTLIGAQSYDTTLFETPVTTRPGVVVRGIYPHIEMVAAGINNVTHGATLRFVAYDTANATTGDFKHWVIGCGGTNATGLYFGYSPNQTNPHYGIGRGWSTGNDVSIFWILNDREVYAENGVRATIFYDRNDTAYYVDPSSNSILLDVEARGGINLRRDLSAATGISFYNTSYYNWQVYMAPAAATGCGANGNLTAPNGLTNVSSWALRSRMENVGSYGWLWELGGSGGGGPTATSLMELDTGGILTLSGQVRAPIFYDRDNTAYYLDPAGNSQVVSIYANDWFRAQGNTGLYFQDKGYGITSAGGASNSYGNASTYGTGLNGWQGWGIGSRHCMMSTGGDNFGVHDNTRSWLYYWNGTYHNFQYGYLESASSVRAPLFYDSNNTTYYVDPASTGYSAYFAGAIQATKIGIEDAGLDCYMEITDANPTVYGVGYGGEFIFYGDKSTPASFLYYGGATVTYTLQANSSLRSPIFYDSNDTGYYLDPASNSVLNGLYVNAYYNLSNDYKDIYVYGDVNTYYVVLIQGEYIYSFGRYSVTRGYNWTGPDTWNTASHKGGLTLDWEWSGDTAWGGNDKAIRIIEFNESYSTMVAGLGYPVNGGVIIWLRGGGVGGAQYRIRTPIGSNTTVTAYDGVSATNHSSSTTFTAANSAVFSSRADVSNVSAEILARYPVRNAASLYNDGNLVVDTGSSTQTKSGIFASAASVRAPIFYDTDNTGYYVDPNSTSNLVGLTVANTITGSISGNSGTVGGLSVHSGRNNEANKVVRTDSNGYIQAGWINTDSGDSGFATRLTRITCSTDNYLRYLGLTDFKVSIGESAKNNYSRRVDYTSDVNYHVGSFGHNGYGANETFHGGSGFIDIWGGTNYPSGLSHIHGFNALHYTVNSLGTTGGAAYGWQMVAQYNSDSGPWWRRCSGGSFSSWLRLVSYGNNQSGTIYASDFYDNDNTAYYINPASASSLNTLTMAGIITTVSTGTAINFSGQSDSIGYNATAGQGTYIKGTGSTYVYGGGTFYDGTAVRTLLHSNNYNSYSPTLTGTGASGTWSINVTGNASGTAASISGFNNPTTAATANTIVYRDGSGHITGNYIFGSYLNSTDDVSTGTITNIVAKFGDNYHRSATAAKVATFISGQTMNIAGSSTSCTGNAASATTAAACTGNSATTTLATKATRANGNFYIDDNYGNTVVGAYSASRYQGVYAMGDSYKLAADGTTTGSLYGIAWSHPNAGGAAGNLSNHGALILINGGYAAAISSSIRCTVDMRTPIYYDSDNTAYYIDAGSTSYLYVLSVASAATAADYYTAGWFRSSTSGHGMYNQVTGQHFYSDSANYWNVASSASEQGIRLRTGGHAGTVRGYFYADTANDVGLLNQAGSWRVRVVGGDYVLFDGSSIRAQIFYDSNDTGYYTDPAGTSILNVVRANSYVQKSASQSLSGTVGCTIDVAAAGIHVLTLAASTTISSFTYNYRAPNPSVNTIMLVIKYGGTASITWTNVLWANGVTPTITGVSGYADVYMLTSYQGTTGVWIGTVVSQGVVSTSL